jgi:DNA mismatch endonuclease (patch repair protein)
MQAVRAKNTSPEIRVRKVAHSLGFRFRLHRKDLPGNPDIVFPRKRICLFVHGCFWHRHSGCPRASVPETNKDFWLRKFSKNTDRDRKVIEKLCEAGWKVEVIWECETKKVESIKKKLIQILNQSSHS